MRLVCSEQGNQGGILVMKKETLSKRVAHSLLLLSLVHVAGVAMPPVAAAATELVDEIILAVFRKDPAGNIPLPTVM